MTSPPARAVAKPDANTNESAAFAGVTPSICVPCRNSTSIDTGTFGVPSTVMSISNPVAVSREEVDPALIEKEKEIAREQMKNKPPQAIQKIVEGKLEKYYQTVCLLDQGFVKQNGEITVRDHILAVGKKLGDAITVRRFVRFQVGEAFAA